MPTRRRPHLPTVTEQSVLLSSARRCCLCLGLKNDWSEKEGQICHVDGNRDNNEVENLVYLCFSHHNQFDSTTSQAKGLTRGEVEKYRALLYEEVVKRLPRPRPNAVSATAVGNESHTGPPHTPRVAPVPLNTTREVATAAEPSDFVPRRRELRTRPADPRDCAFISGTANYWLTGHGIKHQTVRSWLAANAMIFGILECRPDPLGGSKRWFRCGYYSLVPIVGPTHDLLRRGAVEDFEIGASSISSFDDPRVRSLYIMDLMVNSPSCADSRCREIAGAKLISKLRQQVMYILETSPNIKEITSIAASPEGRDQLRTYGFQRDEGYRNPRGWDFWYMTRAEIYRREGGREKCARAGEKYTSR